MHIAQLSIYLLVFPLAGCDTVIEEPDDRPTYGLIGKVIDSYSNEPVENLLLSIDERLTQDTLNTSAINLASGYTNDAGQFYLEWNSGATEGKGIYLSHCVLECNNQFNVAVGGSTVQEWSKVEIGIKQPSNYYADRAVYDTRGIQDKRLTEMELIFVRTGSLRIVVDNRGCGIEDEIIVSFSERKYGDSHYETRAIADCQLEEVMLIDKVDPGLHDVEVQLMYQGSLWRLMDYDVSIKPFETTTLTIVI